MSVIAAVNTATGTSKAIVVAWAGLASGDTGAPVSFSQYTDKSVQVTGAFGGATVVLEGSNDGTNWAVLTDPQGNDLNITAAKIEMVSEATLSVRPRVSGGTGVNVNVTMLLKE